MPFTVTMPKLSPTMEEGAIAKWRIKEGAHVKSGDVMIEVATDKATVEYAAIDEGFLRKIIIKEGDTARVNQPIAIFTEKADESIAGYKPEGETPGPEAPKEKIEEKKEEAEAPAPKMGAMQSPSFVPETPLESYTFSGPTAPIQGRIFASPLARKLAREKGVDLSSVNGSGPQGRIMSRDLETGQPAGLVNFNRGDRPTLAPGTFEEQPLNQMRKAIGRRLQESKTFIPHFYVTQEINAEAMVHLREQFKVGGIKVTINDFIIRAVALTLRRHPEANSGYNSVTPAIIRFKTIDISVAVSLPDGLITPIIRHADYKNLAEISSEIRSLAKRAKEGKLAREEYVGGSFSISNLGMYGVRDFTAIINPPQAAILSVGGIQDKPVVKNGKIVAGKTISVTLGADHRVMDGVDSAKFLQTLQKFLENPSLLVV